MEVSAPLVLPAIISACVQSRRAFAEQMACACSYVLSLLQPYSDICTLTPLLLQHLTKSFWAVGVHCAGACEILPGFPANDKRQPANGQACVLCVCTLIHACVHVCMECARVQVHPFLCVHMTLRRVLLKIGSTVPVPPARPAFHPF